AGREELRQVFDLRLHRVGGVERVGAGGQAHRDTGCGPAVVERDGAVVVAAQLDPRDIPQQHRGAAFGSAQHDALELVGPLQAAVGGYRRVKRRAASRRQTAELAGGDLRVLRADRVGDVVRRQLVVDQLVRIEPDPHRVLRTEQRQFAYALHAAQRILQI